MNVGFVLKLCWIAMMKEPTTVVCFLILLSSANGQPQCPGHHKKCESFTLDSTDDDRIGVNDHSIVILEAKIII